MYAERASRWQKAVVFLQTGRRKDDRCSLSTGRRRAQPVVGPTGQPGWQKSIALERVRETRLGVSCLQPYFGSRANMTRRFRSNKSSQKSTQTTGFLPAYTAAGAHTPAETRKRHHRKIRSLQALGHGLLFLLERRLVCQDVSPPRRHSPFVDDPDLLRHLRRERKNVRTKERKKSRKKKTGRNVSKNRKQALRAQRAYRPRVGASFAACRSLNKSRDHSRTRSGHTARDGVGPPVVRELYLTLPYQFLRGRVGREMPLTRCCDRDRLATCRHRVIFWGSTADCMILAARNLDNSPSGLDAYRSSHGSAYELSHAVLTQNYDQPKGKSRESCPRNAPS